jgi:hypothetical protein
MSAIVGTMSAAFPFLQFPKESTMTLRFLSRCLVMASLAVSFAIPAAAQSIVGKEKTGPVPNPVSLDTTGMFQAKFASVGDDMFIGGQPTEKAIRDLKSKGVTTIVNLRMPEEMTRVGFDEAALAKELGIRYVHIPMRGTPENPSDRSNWTPSRSDGVGGREGAPALHRGVAGQSSLGCVPDSRAESARGNRARADTADQPDG